MSESPARAGAAKRQPLIIVFRGLIDQAGQPSGQILVGYGSFVALVGGLLILVGSIRRSRESGPRRKPPGAL